MKRGRGGIVSEKTRITYIKGHHQDAHSTHIKGGVKGGE